MIIEHLQLLAPDLQSQCNFYHETLGLPVRKRGEHILELQVGRSVLAFRQAPAGWQGAYHFAFNIPENRFAEAKTWLASRTPLLRDANGSDTFRFDDWNAHALYFSDPAGNIAELIARHDLPNASAAPFDSRALQSVSEIGIVAEDVPSFVEQARAAMHVEVYRSRSDNFTAVGDEEGLFVVVKRGRAWFPDTGIPAEALPIVAVVRDASRAAFQFESVSGQITAIG